MAKQTGNKDKAKEKVPGGGRSPASSTPNEEAQERGGGGKSRSPKAPKVGKGEVGGGTKERPLH